MSSASDKEMWREPAAMKAAAKAKRDARILEFLRDGLTHRQVSERLGCSQCVVGDVLAAHRKAANKAR